MIYLLFMGLINQQTSLGAPPSSDLGGKASAFELRAAAANITNITA